MSTENPQTPPADPAPTTGEVQEVTTAYDDLKVDELREEAARRNDVRPDEKDHVVTQGNKAALVAALVADDTAEKPRLVKLQLGDDDPIEVVKPSAEYTNFVRAYGYQEV